LDIRGTKWQEAGEDCIMKNFLTCSYASPNMIRVIKLVKMRWVGYVARTGEMRNAYSILVEKPEGKRPFGRPRLRREDDVRPHVRDNWCKGVAWIYLAQ
jgi:hypothetical protein